MPIAPLMLVGCDFSSRPTRKKPIVLAVGAATKGRVQLLMLERLESPQAFEAWLAQPAAWVGAFDLPFGLPRELETQLGWPLGWEACMHHYASLSRRCQRRHHGLKIACGLHRHPNDRVLELDGQLRDGKPGRTPGGHLHQQLPSHDSLAHGRVGRNVAHVHQPRGLP